MTEPLGLTPSQTAGPYLSIGLLRELVPSELVDPADPRAIRIHGRLLDGAGDGVPDGLVEIWQANAAGRYAATARRPSRTFGRSGTEDDGRFEFVTVKPGRVPWPGAACRRRTSRRRLRARAAQAGRDAALLPRRGGGERGRPGAVRARRPSSARRSSPIAEDGGLRFDIRLQGAGADDILRGVTHVRAPVRPDAARATPCRDARGSPRCSRRSGRSRGRAQARASCRTTRRLRSRRPAPSRRSTGTCSSTKGARRGTRRSRSFARSSSASGRSTRASSISARRART